MASTVDRLSRGRLELGLGAGWMQDDDRRTGIHRDPASVRIERLEESLIVLRGLFSGVPFDFAGRHDRIDALADSLERRRARWGISYWILPWTVMEPMAPLVERLSGC